MSAYANPLHGLAEDTDVRSEHLERLQVHLALSHDAANDAQPALGDAINANSGAAGTQCSYPKFVRNTDTR